MKLNFVELIKLLALLLVVEFIYWFTQDFVIFNIHLIDSLPILYYSSAPLISLLLLIPLVMLRKRTGSNLYNVFFLLFTTYFMFSAGQLYGQYCADIKNLNTSYFLLNTILMLIVIVVGSLFLLRELISEKPIILGLGLVVLFLDYYYFLFGYNMFYVNHGIS